MEQRNRILSGNDSTNLIDSEVTILIAIDITVANKIHRFHIFIRISPVSKLIYSYTLFRFNDRYSWIAEIMPQHHKRKKN